MLCSRLPRNGESVPPPDTSFLKRAWATIEAAAANASVAVILGNERIVEDGLLIIALVINRNGTVVDFQDTVQLDPSEEGIYSPGSGRKVFQSGPLTFGVSICPRRLALSGNRPLGRPARGAHRVPPAFFRRQAGRLRGNEFR